MTSKMKNITHKLFLDTEFTGLHKDTNLVSLALISEEGDWFYYHNDSIVSNEILKEPHNIKAIDKIIETAKDRTLIKELRKNKGVVGVECNKTEHLERMLAEFIDAVHKTRNMNHDEMFEIVVDVGGYDWVLFNDIFGHAFNIPEKVYYIPFELSTMLALSSLENSDNSRRNIVCFDEMLDRSFVDLLLSQSHHALSDAYIIRSVYRIMRKEFLQMRLPSRVKFQEEEVSSLYKLGN